MREFHFTIPIEPKTKKNSQQIIICKGRPMIIPSKQYKEYEKQAMMYLLFNTTIIDYPVNVECHYYMGTKRKCDLTNLLEATDDVLVRAGILIDDNYTIIESHDGSRVHYDKENPRTEIYIKEVQE
ncbi:MAG: RusA family crossover junction endodeoxyribonuclease [Methanobrevibacter sp.]|nr:RusA family crossover junction endodeoxyribonuclease [Methanobrevibacter sp.]